MVSLLDRGLSEAPTAVDKPHSRWDRYAQVARGGGATDVGMVMQEGGIEKGRMSLLVQVVER